MAEQIFRKKSLDKVNSPEQLNEYIRISTPGMWTVMVAVAVLLVSVIVWAAAGTLETTVEAKGIANGENIVCFVPDASDIEAGSKVKLGALEGTVSLVSSKPVSKETALSMVEADEYSLYCLELSDWNYVVEITVSGSTADGFVMPGIITEEVKPISFIYN